MEEMTSKEFDLMIKLIVGKIRECDTMEEVQNALDEIEVMAEIKKDKPNK